MANLESTIDLIFNGIDNASAAADHVGASINNLRNTTSQFSDGLSGIAAPFADLADKLLAVEAAALTAGAALVGLAINAADQFDTSFSEITTLIDKPTEGLQEFRTEILTYAATSTQSLDQVTGAFYNAISQGVAYGDSLKAVTIAEKLAVAGKADLNVTLQGLLGTLNAYGKGMESASEFSDVFFTTVKLGKTTIPELAASISTVTGSASLGGVSIQELGAAIATVTAAGAPTSVALSRINAVLSAMIKPSGEAAELAKSLGIEFDINALKSKGLAGVLADVAAKTGGAGDKMAVLFGSTEALNAANVLAVTSSGKFRDNLAAMKDAAGATEAAFAKMKGATDTMAQAFQVALVSFGTPLLDSFGNVQDALSGLAVGFIKASESGAFKGLQALISTQLDSIASTIETAAGNLPAAFERVDWSGVISSLRELGGVLADVFAALFGNIDITTVDGLAIAIQTVMNSFESLTRVVSGIIREFTPFAAAIGETVQGFNRLDDASKLEFGQTLGGMKAITDAGAGLGLTLIAIGRAGIDMADVINVAFGGVKVAVNALQVTFDAVVLGFLNIKKSVLDTFLALNEAAGAVAFTDAAKAANAAAIAGIKSQLAELQPVMDGVAANMARNSAELTDGLNQMGDGFAGTSEQANKARARLDESEAAIRRAGEAAKPAAEKVTTVAVELAKIAQTQIPKIEINVEARGGLVAAEMAGQLKRTGEASQELVPKLVTVRDANQNVINTYTKMVPASSLAAGGFSVIGKSSEDAAKKVSEATKKSDEFLVKMEQIASNERIKKIEAVVSIKTAELEADAKRVQAVFASIDNTVSSTGDLLGTLFGSFNNAKDSFDQAKIESQIDLENKRRQEALDLQKKLAEAEIERINAQTASLNRGDALIKIEGDGLKPELEAFMWKILSLIRVRANAEFSQYLLGVAS